MEAYQWAGVAMPWRYARPLAEEHAAVRHRCGIVDASQLRVLEVVGPGSGAVLDTTLSRRVSGLRPGTSRHALVHNRRGRVADELIALRLDADRYWLSTGAGCTRVRLAELGVVAVERDDLHVIAVQGPGSAAVLGRLVDASGLGPGEHRPVGGVRVARAGFTGELGFELYLDGADAVETWRALLAAGAEAYGYACVDLLRIEAGFLLYPNDLSPVGAPPGARVGGLLAPGPESVPRGTVVHLGGAPVGLVTSSAYGPVQDAVLCLALLAPPALDRHDTVGLGEGREGRLVGLPFVERRDR